LATIAGKFSLSIIGLRRGRIELVKGLKKRGFARLVAADKGSYPFELYPSAVVDVAKILDSEPNRLQAKTTPQTARAAKGLTSWPFVKPQAPRSIRPRGHAQ
jgi:hypothetical protein